MLARKREKFTKRYRGPVTPKSVPPKVGPAGRILAEKFAKIGPPGPILAAKTGPPVKIATI